MEKPVRHPYVNKNSTASPTWKDGRKIQIPSAIIALISMTSESNPFSSLTEAKASICISRQVSFSFYD